MCMKKSCVTYLIVVGARHAIFAKICTGVSLITARALALYSVVRAICQVSGERRSSATWGP